jgi:hypothetical protein
MTPYRKNFYPQVNTFRPFSGSINISRTRLRTAIESNHDIYCSRLPVGYV